VSLAASSALIVPNVASRTIATIIDNRTTPLFIAAIRVSSDVSAGHTRDLRLNRPQRDIGSPERAMTAFRSSAILSFLIVGRCNAFGDGTFRIYRKGRRRNT
jgi:hypothetical protein